LITEDKVTHQLTGQQLNELQNITVGVNELNKTMLRAFGHGETFESMNKALQESLKKDPTVNLTNQQVIASNTTDNIHTDKKKSNGINLNKKRSA
jgi:hypothetical protein